MLLDGLIDKGLNDFRHVYYKVNESIVVGFLFCLDIYISNWW